MTRVSKLFELNREALNVQRGLMFVAFLLVPGIILAALDAEQYLLSAVFGGLLVGLSDPGGEFGFRARRMAEIAVIGGLLTAIGFGIGDGAWEIVVLVTFAVTLLAGLAVRFGLNRFAAAFLLNIWFIVAIGLPVAYKLDGIKTTAWSQTLGWLTGSAVWIALACMVWLARGRKWRAQPVPEIPGDLEPVPLTRPIVLFAVVRAITMAIAVAIPFGFHLPKAYWMPLAAIVAMKPSLEQSTLIAEQRVAGTIVGAAVAAVFLLTLDSKHALELVVLALFAVGMAIRGVNYSLYTAAIAGAVLIAVDIPDPTNLANEAYRVLFTFAGVGLAVLVLFLATELQKRKTAKAARSGVAGTPRTT